MAIMSQEVMTKSIHRENPTRYCTWLQARGWSSFMQEPYELLSRVHWPFQQTVLTDW